MALPVIWREGWNACDKDLDVDDCPYEFLSPEWELWMAGYRAYQDENEND